MKLYKVEMFTHSHLKTLLCVTTPMDTLTQDSPIHTIVKCYYLTLKSISSSNNLQNSEMNFYENMKLMC
jgi:hypothetical protein